MLPSTKITLPVGMLPVLVMVIAKMTLRPAVDGLMEAASDAVETAFCTVCVKAEEVLPL